MRRHCRVALSCITSQNIDRELWESKSDGDDYVSIKQSRITSLLVLSALLITLTACAQDSADTSEAACIVLDQCSTVTVSSDKEACLKLIEILKPMNNGSAPAVSKYEKAWPEIESLAFQVEDSELRSALNETSINMHSFVKEMQQNNSASTFILAAMRSSFEKTLSACAGVLN